MLDLTAELADQDFTLPDTPRHMSQDTESLAVIQRQRDLALACLLKGGGSLDRVAELGLAYEHYRHRSRTCAEALLAGTGTAAALKADDPDFTALCDLQLRGLDIEGRIQHLMGEFGSADLALLIDALKALTEQQPLPPTTELGRLALGEPLADLPGMVLIAPAGACQAPASPATTFLAWPRLPGGLRRFDSPDQARQFVHEQLLLEADAPVQARHAGSEAFTAALAQLVDNAWPALRDPAQSEACARDLLDELVLPPHAPRDHALELTLAAHTEQSLARQDMAWFTRLALADQERVVTALAEHCTAQEQAMLHTAHALPDRMTFLREQAASLLQADFAVQGRCQIIVSMPDRLVATQVSSEWAFDVHVVPGEHDVVEQPPNVVLAPSDTLEHWPLEQLLAYQIDDDMAARLAHMTVRVETADPRQAMHVERGITAAWLKESAQRLDVAKAYEQRIFAHFNPALEHDAPTRVTLRKPYETALALQVLLAQVTRQLAGPDCDRLRRAIDAHTAEQWGTLTLGPIAFTLFDPSSQASAARIEQAMLLADSLDGRALVYLPGAPHNCLTAHVSQAAALEWLADQCLNPAMLDYLTQRASKGDAAWLKARINRALAQGFRALFKVPATWPAHRSMAQQLLNEQAGRLIRQHRETSRSAGDLLMQSVEQSRQHVVDCIMLALAYVPVVGTVIGLAQGIHSLYRSARYLEHSKAPDALLEAQLAMASLLGAMVDLLPAGNAQRALRRTRPLVLLPAQQIRRASGFDGYAQAVSLQGLAPSQEGHLAGTYSLSGSRYIERQGQVYGVSWDADAATWRLKRPGRAFAEQAIARDAQGQWETHLALYGQMIRGGLNGGSGRTLWRRVGSWLPLWLRRYLPQSWLAVMESDAQALQRLKAVHLSSVDRAKASTARLNADPQSEAYYQRLAEDAAARVDAAERVWEFWSALPGRKKARLAAGDVQHETDQLTLNLFTARAYALSAQSRQRNHIQRQILAQDERNRLLAQQCLASHAAGAPDGEQVDLLQRLLEGRAQARRWVARRLVEESQMIDTQAKVSAAHTLLARECLPHLPAQVRQALEPLQAFVNNLPAHRLEAVEVRTLAELFVLELPNPESLRLHNRCQRLSAGLLEALVLYVELPTAQLNPQESAAIKRQINDLLDDFRGQINAIARQEPELIDQRIHDRLKAKLPNLHQRVREASEPQARAPQMPHPRRPFQDQQGRWYLGVRQPNGHYVVHALAGTEQVWVKVPGTRRFARRNAEEPIAGSRFVAQAPEQLHARSQQAIDAAADAEIRGERLARSSTATGPDIQGFFDAEADRLQDLGNELARHEGVRYAQMAQQLHTRAAQLRQAGIHQRIAFSNNPQAPSASKLDFLLRHGQVRVRRVGHRRYLQGGDHLQEFEITDATSGNPLWYAHYHYRHANDDFTSFTKAHLKTPEQRNLGLNWQVAQGEQAPRILRAPLDLSFTRLHQQHFLG